MKGATQSEFLPSDYVTNARIDEMRQSIIKLMVDNEANIDNGRVVSVKPQMEDMYKRALIGIGVYGPEKLIYAAFADKKPTLQDTNVMFVSATNERRDEVMTKAAKAFVEGSFEKTTKKNLCVMKEGFKEVVSNKKYISLPDGMPYFSDALKTVLTEEPYNMDENNITLNAGELEISIDDMYENVPLSMLACIDEMKEAYDKVDSEVYFGIHVDEVNKDMRAYPDIA